MATGNRNESRDRRNSKEQNIRPVNCMSQTRERASCSEEGIFFKANCAASLSWRYTAMSATLEEVFHDNNIKSKKTHLKSFYTVPERR